MKPKGVGKSGRPRSSQRGQLLLDGGVWRARYYVYRGEKRIRKSAKIGRMPEPQARAILKSIIEKENEQAILGYRVGHMSAAMLSPTPTSTRRPWELGVVGELLVSADLLQKGFHVYKAVSPSASCDLLAMSDDGKIIRVEVKASNSETGNPRIDIRDRIGRFDLLAVLLHDGTIVYRPHEEICNWVYPVETDANSGQNLDRAVIASDETKVLI